MDARPSRPSPAEVAAFVERLADAPASFVPAAGPGTGPGGPAPPGFDLDRRRVRLGDGDACFAAAREAVRRWRPFDLGWVELVPSGAPLEPGAVVATLTRVAGLWWLNPCRVVTVEDVEAGSGGGAGAADGVRRQVEGAGTGTLGWVRRFGFTYVTLEGHVERGEERFRVEMLADGSVWYDLAAVSRPGHWLVHLAYPWVRSLQRRFALDSLAAMQRATVR